MSSVNFFFACQAQLKPNNFDDFIFLIRYLCRKCKKKIGFYQKSYFFKIKLNDQPRDAKKSRAKFWGYFGNQNHPKLSARTYGFNCAFYMAHILE